MREVICVCLIREQMNAETENPNPKQMTHHRFPQYRVAKDIVEPIMRFPTASKAFATQFADSFGIHTHRRTNPGRIPDESRTNPERTPQLRCKAVSKCRRQG